MRICCMHGVMQIVSRRRQQCSPAITTVDHQGFLASVLLSGRTGDLLVQGLYQETLA